MTKIAEKTPADYVASLVKAGPGIEIDDSPVRRFVVRLPSNTVAYVDALAEHGGRSRNFMISQLLIVGVQAVIDALPDGERESVQGSWLLKMSEYAEGGE
jgi:predicted transcriptional regulator